MCAENHCKIHPEPHDYSRSKRSLVFICFESLVFSFCRSASSCGMWGSKAVDVSLSD